MEHEADTRGDEEPEYADTNGNRADGCDATNRRPYDETHISPFRHHPLLRPVLTAHRLALQTLSASPFDRGRSIPCRPSFCRFRQASVARTSVRSYAPWRRGKGFFALSTTFGYLCLK